MHLKNIFFGLSQNWFNSYPEHQPYGVIDFQDTCKKDFAYCDEKGNADWLPHPPVMKFKFASKEVQEAFKGETEKRYDAEKEESFDMAIVTFEWKKEEKEKDWEWRNGIKVKVCKSL